MKGDENKVRQKPGPKPKLKIREDKVPYKSDKVPYKREENKEKFR